VNGTSARYRHCEKFAGRRHAKAIADSGLKKTPSPALAYAGLISSDSGAVTHILVTGRLPRQSFLCCIGNVDIVDDTHSRMVAGDKRVFQAFRPVVPSDTDTETGTRRP
jgi:hypothetical protein